MAANAVEQNSYCEDHPMLRITRLFATFLVAGAITPLAANAASFGTLLHPTTKTAKTQKITFVLLNRSEVRRAVTVDGKTYTLTPHQQVSISAPAGTQVMENTSGTSTSGKVLFTVGPIHSGTTVSLN